jgi:Flp pilus assembly protein TadG
MSHRFATPWRRPGQAAVEFALVVILFLGLFMAIFEGARFATTAFVIANAAEDGARAGLYFPTSSLPVATIDGYVRTAVRERTATFGWIGTIPDANITICRHALPSAAVTSTCDTTAPPLLSGSVIDVTVTYTFTFFSFPGNWLGQGSHTLTGYRRARLE